MASSLYICSTQDSWYKDNLLRNGTDYFWHHRVWLCIWSNVPQGLRVVYVWVLDSVHLSPHGRLNPWIKSASGVWRYFEKHSAILLAAVTSTHHGASVTSKAPGYSCCLVRDQTAAREYCGFSKSGGKVRDNLWMSQRYLREITT